MSAKADDSFDPEQEDFVQFLREHHERLLGNLGESRFDDEHPSAPMRSAARVLRWLDEWRADAEADSTEKVLSPRDFPRFEGMPQSFGRFEVKGIVGRGGYGIVLRAYDPKLQRNVAIKVPKIDALLSPEANARFQRESTLAASLSHPGIVPVFETDHCNGIDYMVSEFVDGDDLASRCARGQRFAAKEAARCVRRLSDAIEYAHQCGVLHRDLKPSNVLIPGDDLSLAKITDFGLATVIDETDLTHTGSVLGTPAFMSPEQADGRRSDIGPATDVYGLGTVLYQLLTGVPPFSGVTIAQTARAVVSEPPKSPRSLSPDCPKDLEAICLRALKKNPTRRYESAAAMRADLDRFLSGEPTEARSPTIWAKGYSLARRYPAAAIAIGTLLLVSIIAPLVATNMAQLTRAAEQSEKQLQRALYVSDMNLVVREWQSANVQRCEKLLRRHIPSDGKEDLRGFEWYYYWNKWQQSNEKQVLFEDKRLESVAVSPAGNQLALGCYDGTVILCTNSGEELRSWKAHQARTIRMDFDHEGRWLATTDADRSVRVWDVKDGELLYAFEGQWSLDFAHRVSLLAFRDKRSVSVVRFSGQGEPKTQRLEELDSQEVFAVKLSPDGTRLAIAGRDGGVAVWNAETMELVDTLDEDVVWFWSLAWSPTGKMLAAAGSGGEVRIWNAATGTAICRFRGHENTVWDLAFSQDESTLATCSTDNLCKVWRVDDGSLVRRFLGHFSEVTSLAFSPDQERLLSVSLDGTLVEWPLESQAPREVLIHPDACASVTFSTDGKTLATGCCDGQLRTWATSTGQELRAIRAHAPSAINCQFAYLGDREVAVTIGIDPWLRFWDQESGELMEEISARGGASDVPPLAVNRARDSIAFARSNTEVGIWNGSDATIKSIPCKNVRWLALAPDTSTLAIASGTSFQVWDVASAELLVDREFSPIQQMTYSPDGKFLALAGYDRLVRLIEVKRLISNDDAYQPVSLEGTPALVGATIFSADGNTIFSGGEDSILRIWNATLRQERCALKGHASGITSIATWKDELLATSSYDGTVRFWRARR